MVTNRPAGGQDGDIVISRKCMARDAGHEYFVGRLPQLHQFRFGTYERAFAIARTLAAEQRGTIWVNDDSADWSLAIG